MDAFNPELLAVVFLIAGLFLLVLMILWFILPFLIMGTNKRLDRILLTLNDMADDARESNQALKKLTRDVDQSLNN